MHARVSAFAALALLSAGTSAAQQSPDLTPYLIPDRAAEVGLARSALPKPVSDSATVLVLTRSGYVEAVRGTNGFTCMVQRSYDGRIGGPGFWDPSIRAPICLNPPASRSVLPEMRKRAEWIMAGVSPSEIAARTKKAYASHEFPVPEVGSTAFMLSPEQHLSNTNPHWMPHLMFFYDKSVPAAVWGVSGATSAIIDGSGLDPDAQATVILVPVRVWADGRPAMPDSAH